MTVIMTLMVCDYDTKWSAIMTLIMTLIMTVIMTLNVN